MKTGATARRVKTTLKVLTFTVLLVLAFLYAAAVLQPVNDEIIGMRGFYAEQKDTLDAVYIGGSVCIVCWAPYVAWNGCGIPSYAFGTDSLNSFSVLPLAREALSRQSPQVLVIDLRPFQYTDPDEEIYKEHGLACASGMPLLSPNRFEILRRSYTYSTNKLEQDTPLTFYFDIARYHGSWKLLSANSFQYAIPGARQNANKGYLFIPNVATVQLTDNTAETARLPVSSLAEENLVELLDYLKAKDQKALFVVTTYAETDTDRRQYNYLADILHTYGFDYLNANDYNDETDMDPQNDYYNRAHTNINGAEKYTKFVADYLKQHYDMPDRRNDDAYQSWVEGYEVWTKTVSEVKAEIQQDKADNAKEDVADTADDAAEDDVDAAVDAAAGQGAV
jgi:hypothetical protein